MKAIHKPVVLLLLLFSTFIAFPQGTVTDIDGNVYQTVIIGDQEWMASDLKVTRYNNGDALLTDQTHNQWQTSTEGIWAYYDNNPSNNELYGKLYNWYATVDERGLCPSGWRVPTDNDWQTLVEFIDPNTWGNNNRVGSKLKSCRQVNSPLGGDCNTTIHPRWDSHSKRYGTDEFGFGALPGGTYSVGAAFVHLGSHAYYWSTTDAVQGQAWVRVLLFSHRGISRGQYQKRVGLSVRCIKGDEPAIQVPQVITLAPSNITETTATCGGNVISDGGSPVNERGLVWSTTQNPTVEENMGLIPSGNGLGSYNVEITALEPGTVYWVRAYATNDVGTGYGANEMIETLEDQPTPSNTIIVHDATAEAGTQITIEVEMINEGDITAFQMDFELPDGFTYVEDSYILSDRSQEHTPGQSILTNGKLRLLAYSATNNVFLDNSGILFTFKLNTPAQAGTWELNASNVNLTNTSFENVFDGAEGGNLTIFQATSQYPNKYFFRDTTESNTGGTGYKALHAGYAINEITNTFSYDFWVKPTRAINMVGESNACSGNVSVPLAHSNQNWAIVPQAPNLHMAVGLTIGTNGLMIGEHSGNILVSRLSYTTSITDWVHVAIVYQPDSIFLYLNGDLVRSRLRPCPNSDRYISAGLTGYYYSTDFKGNFDEFRLWDIALKQEQVSIIKDKKLMSPVFGLRYYASFDEGAFERTLGDIGDVNITVNGNITPEANIKESEWDLERYTGDTIETLVPF